MNAHNPFDAKQDWTNPYCQNSSNDPMVDALLGNAYHVVRTVYCNLGNLKLLYDFLNQYGMVIGVNSEEELKALSTQVKYSRIYGFSRAGDRQVTDYLYVEGDRTGILPNDPAATGSWITVATTGSNGGGTSSGEGAYIPWVYANGSATGGETSINVPDGTVGVSFIIINGDMQYVGRGFEFNVDSLSVTLAQPLEEGDEVVFLLTGVPAVPDNPNVNDWVQINWLYNNGAAVGGEQVIAIPYTFQSIPAVYKNGLRLVKNLSTNSYLIDPDNQSIILTEPLATDDRVIIQIGGEARVLEATDRTVQEIARSLNVRDSSVILSTNATTTLNDKEFLYAVEQQKVYELPPLPSNIYIASVSGQTLTYNPGGVQVGLKEVSAGNVLQAQIDGLWDDLADTTKGDGLIGVKQPYQGAVNRTQHDKNSELLSMADFSGASAAVTAALSKSNAILFNNTNAFNLTVGAGGQFTNLMDAILAAQRIRPLWKNGNGFCNIRLQSGFILDQQLVFEGGVDLSWIKITSVDSVVYANTSAFTISVRTYYEYKYLFYIKDGAKSPIFAIQIEENRATSDVCAFIVTQHGQLNFYNMCGARKFYVGIHGSYGAEIRSYHTGCAADEASVLQYMPAGYYVCDFTYSRYAALQLVDNVIINMPISKFDYCNENNVAAVNCIYNVIANFHGSSATHCYIGWNIRDGSIANIRDHKTMHCTYRGLTMIHTAYVDARRHDVDEANVATSGKVLEPLIEKGFYGCTLGVRGDGAGCVDVAGNDMRNCGTTINIDNGFVLSGKGLDVSGCTGVVFSCQGGRVEVPRLWAENVKKFCSLKYGASVTARWATITTDSTYEMDTRFFDIDYAAKVSLHDSTITGDVSLFAGSGSTLHCIASALKVRSVRAFSGSTVNVTGCTYDPAYAKAISTSEIQFRISKGGYIHMNPITITDGSAPVLAKPKNTISDAGIIFAA